MKKTILLLLVILLAGFSLFAEEKKAVDMEKEKAAIKATALNYIEGWFEGNPERMDKALHPALNKVGIRSYSPDGKKVLTPIGHTAMVELARMGAGKRIPKDKAGIKVTILDIHKNMASVKTECVQFIDYLLLGKMKGEWKIINVLWVPNQVPNQK